MAHAIVYKRPNEKFQYTFDFADDLRSTDNVKAVGGGSATTVTATDSSGTDASSTIVSSKTASGDTLVAVLQGGTDFEDYTVLYIAEGDTSGDKFEKILELRVRNTIVGGI